MNLEKRSKALKTKNVFFKIAKTFYQNVESDYQATHEDILLEFFNHYQKSIGRRRELMDKFLKPYLENYKNANSQGRPDDNICLIFALELLAYDYHDYFTFADLAPDYEYTKPSEIACYEYHFTTAIKHSKQK